MLSESCTITAVINYRCYPVTPSRQQPKYAIGASGPLEMGTNLKKEKSAVSIKIFPNLLFSAEDGVPLQVRRDGAMPTLPPVRGCLRLRI